MKANDPYKPLDVQASSLEDAISQGLTELGLSRNDVIIEIIEEGSRGVLGMGVKDALVRLTPLKAPNPPATRQAPPQAQPKPEPVQEAVSEPEPEPTPEPEPEPESQPEPEPENRQPEPVAAVEEVEEDEYDAADEDDDIAFEDVLPERQIVTDFDDSDDARIALEALQELLGLLTIEADIKVSRAEADEEENPPWVLDIHGSDLGILIGRGGDTLSSLQYITRQIVSRELQRRANIVLDVEGYKYRRERALQKLAQRMASQAKRLGRSVTLEPMPPNERRIIHITLRKDKTVRTESDGHGNQRKVTIIPTDN